MTRREDQGSATHRNAAEARRRAFGADARARRHGPGRRGRRGRPAPRGDLASAPPFPGQILGRPARTCASGRAIEDGRRHRASPAWRAAQGSPTSVISLATPSDLLLFTRPLGSRPWGSRSGAPRSGATGVGEAPLGRRRGRVPARKARSRPLRRWPSRASAARASRGAGLPLLALVRATGLWPQQPGGFAGGRGRARRVNLRSAPPAG